ncbi:hypothetical protein EXIGLDRAFT_736552 [Exidia glandulosa HHB12029]|uniref:Uncharacterized protein n=1 Tax=Exidia glandulosa HHB12029 TaxID=1314781 RepID=A0A166AS71_EXIGL|nr:hypothetical protein EXIGLDRAFT_736552 [Exidia glandulosa HHB12029]
MVPPDGLRAAAAVLIAYPEAPPWARNRVAGELSANISFDDSRWDDISGLVGASHWSSVYQRSHKESVRLLPTNPSALAGVKLGYMLRVRYPDAPFMPVDAFVHAVRRTGLDASEVVWMYLRSLPPNLVRLDLDWERARLTRTAEEHRANAADSLRELERHISPRVMSSLHSLFVGAYAATRVAPRDSLRHWAALVRQGRPIPLASVERGLSSARDLDTLHRIWHDISTSPPPEREHVRPGVLNVREMYLVHHLVRLGALDEARELADKYPYNGNARWVLETEWPEEKGQEYVHARLNLRRAGILIDNGLDLEAVLYILSLHSPFFQAVLGLRPNYLRGKDPAPEADEEELPVEDPPSLQPASSADPMTLDPAAPSAAS